METNLMDSLEAPVETTPWIRTTQLFELNAYCYSDRIEMLPRLTSVFTNSGGWVLERRTLSPTAMDFRFEIQLMGIVELYGQLVGLGLELTRTTHDQLTELCTLWKHMMSSRESCPVVTVRLEIQFLADVTLHSILMTGSSHA
jgi:hypothetical protein